MTSLKGVGVMCARIANNPMYAWAMHKVVIPRNLH